MTRAEKIENIIIGSLICNFNEHWPSVRCCITEEMFSNDFNRKLFAKMKQGKVGIIELSNGLATAEVLRILELSCDYDFNYLKCNHNEMQYLFVAKPEYTSVSFDDYVSAFITYTYNGKR